jgi:YHS domain-containing protein
MRKSIEFLSVLVLVFLLACTNSEPSKDAAVAPVKYGSQMTINHADTSHHFTADMVQNKRDFICGMPVTAGIADTAHFKGKVYGFCAAECKEAFLKSPEAYTAQK